MDRLFGTDGIRGLARKFPLTSKDVFLIGLAAGRILRAHVKEKICRILGVRDTRWSGPFIWRSLTAGLRKSGVDVYDAGVLSTPSVAYLVQAHRFDSGFVISASHNPPQFNGIKFFNARGRKWPDTWEEATETLFKNLSASAIKSTAGNNRQGALVPADSLADDYVQFLLDTLDPRPGLSRFRIAVDCAHGANSVLAPRILRQLGVQLFVRGNKPDGTNINIHCGSQHTEPLSQWVVKKRCQAGVAFDGDGDRVIFIDEKGSIVDGDHILALLARSLKRKGKLANSSVVITVMANLGLKKALAKMGIKAIEVPVGDRHVSAAMDLNGAVLGGEQSGHIILGHYLPTGDGLLTALHVLAIMAKENKPLSQLAGWMEKFPQILVNVPVKERRPIPQLNGVQSEIDRITGTLGANGRLLVRYSGTEPILRIMLEGPDADQLKGYAHNLAASVTKAFS